MIKDAYNQIKDQKMPIVSEIPESLKITFKWSRMFDKIYSHAEKLCFELGLEIRYNQNFYRSPNMNHDKTKFQANDKSFIKNLESRTTKKEEFSLSRRNLQ